MKISSKESLLGKFNMAKAGRGTDKPVSLSQFIYTDRLARSWVVVVVVMVGDDDDGAWW